MEETLFKREEIDEPPHGQIIARGYGIIPI